MQYLGAGAKMTDFLQDLISFHHKCNGTDCNLSKNNFFLGCYFCIEHTVFEYYLKCLNFQFFEYPLNWLFLAFLMNFCPLKMLTRNVECDFLGDFQTLCEHVIFVYKIKIKFFSLKAPRKCQSHTCFWKVDILSLWWLSFVNKWPESL